MAVPAVKVEARFTDSAKADSYSTFLSSLISSKTMSTVMPEGIPQRTDEPAGSAPYVVQVMARTQSVADADDIALQSKNKWLDAEYQPTLSSAGAWRHFCHADEASPQACVETIVYEYP